MWHIHPEYQQYLDIENFDSEDPVADNSDLNAVASTKSGTTKKSKAADATDKTKSATIDTYFAAKGNKRKIDETSQEKVGVSADTPREPKKLKRAFGFFVKAKRTAAESLVKDASVIHFELLRLFLLQ